MRNEMKEKIKSEMISAMKSKNAERLSIIRLINGKITEALKSKPDSSSDELISVLDQMVKERNKTIEIYREVNETEKMESEQYEVSTINEFLPQRMDIVEITSVIKEIIESTGAQSMKDMGKVMGIAKGKFGSSATPSDITQVIKSELS